MQVGSYASCRKSAQLVILLSTTNCLQFPKHAMSKVGEKVSEKVRNRKLDSQ